MLFVGTCYEFMQTKAMVTRKFAFSVVRQNTLNTLAAS